MIEDIELLFDQLKSVKRIYYAVSTYVPNKDEIIRTSFPDFGDLYIMHPDRFFEFWDFANEAGYLLVDFRTVNPLPLRAGISRSGWSH